MSKINQLTAADTVVAGDSFPVWSTQNGNERRAPMSVLQTYLQANLTFDTGFTKQYSAPSASGFNAAITDSSVNTWLILTPTGTFGTGTITLPAVANAADGQEIVCNCTQIVTTLTVAGNGATVTGAPTSFAANDFFRLGYDLITTTWYRIG